MHVPRFGRGIPLRIGPLAVAVALGFGMPALAAGDRHANYYYPAPTSRETYAARVDTLPEANRHARIAFVTNITNGMLTKKPYPPPFAIFAKGTDAQKLIIIGLYDNTLNTIYRARALLAQLTATARVTPLFRERFSGDNLTFLDLCKLLGFRLLTISDGKSFAHQIVIE